MPSDQLSEVGKQLRKIALRDGAGLTDGQLLGCYVTRHDEAALAALVRRHGAMVWSVCFRILRNHHDAEDAVQASFLVLVRKAGSVLPREMVANWLYGVAHQTALKARATVARRRAREKQVMVMPEPAVTQSNGWHDFQPLLDAELSLLPDKYRVVIVLCDLEGNTRKQVARQLGCPEGTIAARVSRARALLAKRLARRGVTLSCGSLAVTLWQNASSTCVPASVLSSTIKAATLMAARQLAVSGTLSVKAAALSERLLKAMKLTKLNPVTAAFLIGGVVGLGTANMVHETGVPPVHFVKPVRTVQNTDQAKTTRADLRWSPLGRPLYLLVSNPVIQTELRLNANQKKSMAAFQAEVVEPLRDMQDLNWDERDRRYAHAKEKFKEGLPKILDSQQLQRLREIDLQQRTCRGILSDEEIMGRLKLTAEQLNTIQKSADMGEFRSHKPSGQLLQVNDVYKNYKKEMAEERRALIQELFKLHADGHQRLRDGLTEEQNKQLRTMLGKPIDVLALLEAIE